MGQPSKVFNSITSHPMFEDGRKFLISQIKSAEETKLTTQIAEYRLEIFDLACALIESLELLERSRNFITTVPADEYLQKQKINRHDWIEYQISIFLITLITVGDQVLHLVNAVFCLGLDPKHCRPEIIKKNRWVADTVIPKRLDAIKQTIEAHRQPRNILVHQGVFPSLNKLFKSDNLDQMKKISFALQYSPQSFSATMKSKLCRAYDKEVLRVGQTMDEEVFGLRTVLLELLDALHEHYSSRVSFLQNMTSK